MLYFLMSYDCSFPDIQKLKEIKEIHGDFPDNDFNILTIYYIFFKIHCVDLHGPLILWD